MKYEEVYKDHHFLWSIGPANDMTGVYVDQHDLEKLLKNPNKKTAKSCLIAQMEYWFRVGIENGLSCSGTPSVEFIGEYPEIIDIAEKYGFEL